MSQRRDWTSLPEAIRALDGTDKELASFRRRNRSSRAQTSLGAQATRAPMVREPLAYVPPHQRSHTPLSKPFGRDSKTPGREWKAVTCFNCQESGHISRDCPHPKRERTVNEMVAEEAEDEFFGQEFEEGESFADEDEQSGNEEA